VIGIPSFIILKFYMKIFNYVKPWGLKADSGLLRNLILQSDCRIIYG